MRITYFLILLLGVMVGGLIQFYAAPEPFVCEDIGFHEGVKFAIDGEREDRCNMRFDKEIIGVNGLYSDPNYFCVWTEGRTQIEIAETTYHELAHYYSYKDTEHFNVDWNNETHKWNLEKK